MERFKYLSGLDLADPVDSSENLPISILIGADYYWKALQGRSFVEGLDLLLFSLDGCCLDLLLGLTDLHQRALFALTS